MWYGFKGYSSFDMSVLIYLNYIYVFILLAHPICLCLAMIVYCVTCEQMMLQVDLVRQRVGAWAILGIFYRVLLLYRF